MEFPIYDVSDSQVEAIIELTEDYLNDLKGKDIKPAKLSETVSAFANSGGGDIYLGIEEEQIANKKIRKWRGFKDPEEANDFVQVLFAAHAFGNHLLFEFFQNANQEGIVLHITVRKVKEIVKASNQEVFVRVGAGKLKIASQQDLLKLKLDKGIISFEDEWVEASQRVVENSEAIIAFVLSVIPSSEPAKYLSNQELIKPGFVKVAGILLFADEPAIFLPKRCSVKLMRYKTKADTIEREFLASDPVTIEGCAYHVIYEAVSQTKKMVEGIMKLSPDGLVTVRYPDETLHEIITNAVLHRDYSIAADIQVRVYDNRVEIESPGRLPGHVTIDNILDTQSARNAALVRLINKFPNPPNKDVGEGLNTAFAAMKNLRLRPPSILETQNSVLVAIRHEPLASPEQIVMGYVKTHDEINNRTARELTGIKSENSMKNVFLRLKERGELEQLPDRKGARAAWRKAKKN
jgi:ATP-dependent DNA helicase RecG